VTPRLLLTALRFTFAALMPSTSSGSRSIAIGSRVRKDARMADPMSGSLRPHRAARAEERLHAMIEHRLRARGWTPRVVPYVGYGTDRWVRVLARVLLAPPTSRPGEDADGRGWRRFLSASAAGVPVTIQVGEQPPRGHQRP
jgi:hypothetical protein